MLKKLKQIVLSNYFLESFSFILYRNYLKLTTKNIIGRGVCIGTSSVLEGRNAIGARTRFIGSHLGFASYISSSSNVQNIKIGKYCSIGPNISTIHGRHPTRDFVSTHPVFFSLGKHIGFSYTTKQLFDEFPKPSENNSSYTTTVGNDVWIGANVLIIEGVKIGNGAIIASGSVVSRDVPDYCIYGGVPAKKIRNRFELDEIDFLLKLKWWDKSDEWIKEHSLYFTNVKFLINQLQNRN